MAKPKISVIIPVYNSEQYIEETLNSLLNQTIIDDIEVLMIDDGSTDDSRYIIEKYALDHDNFFAFHKKNERQAIARNYGLDCSNGDYIYFLDSDDYLSVDAFEKLYLAATNGDYDFVVCNAFRFNRYNCWESKIFKNSFKGFNQSSAFTSISECPSFLWDASSVNKLYKKEFLNKKDIRFIEENIFFEDVLFAFECYVKSDSFYFLNEYLYYWRYRDNLTSVTQHNSSVNNFKNRLAILQIIRGLIKKYNIDQSSLSKLYERWLIHDLGMHIDYMNNFPCESHESLIDEVSDIVSDIPQEIKEDINSYYKVIYKLIQNRDIENLLYFTSLENKLKKQPDFELKLSDEYTSLINFDEDVMEEEFSVNTTNIDHDDENIIIGFEWDLNYFSRNHPYNIEAILIDESNGEDTLNIEDNQIFIPFEIIRDKKQVCVKIKLSTDFFTKETFLKNNLKRANILYGNVDFELAVGINTKFYIHSRPINQEEILIDNVSFEDGTFIFEGSTDLQLKKVMIENVVTFEQIECPVNFDDNSNFKFSIPYCDIIKPVIKKWELKSDYLIKLPKSFEFFKENDKVLLFNFRNIILIEDDLYNKFDKLQELNIYFKKNRSENKFLTKKNTKLSNKNTKLKDKITKLKDKNTKLKNKNTKLTNKNARLSNKNTKLKNKLERMSEKNKKLQNLVKAYESRKIVRLVDKLKFK